MGKDTLERIVLYHLERLTKENRAPKLAGASLPTEVDEEHEETEVEPQTSIEEEIKTSWETARKEKEERNDTNGKRGSPNHTHQAPSYTHSTQLPRHTLTLPIPRLI